MKSNSQHMTPGEVAAVLNVNPKTVTRWAQAGLIGSFKTPGGQYRLYRSEIEAILNGDADHGPDTSQYWKDKDRG